MMDLMKVRFRGMAVVTGPWWPHLHDLSLTSVMLGLGARASQSTLFSSAGATCSSSERPVALLTSLAYVPSAQKVCTLLNIHTPHIFQGENRSFPPAPSQL